MYQRLHIAFFTNSYKPVVTGVVRSISTFRETLISLGHLIFVFAPETGDYQDDEPFIFRFPSIDLPAAHDFPLTIPVSPFVDKLLPLLKLDVIHSHHPFLLGHSAAKRAADLDLPLVFTFHSRYRDYSSYIALNQNLVKGIIDRMISDYMRHCQHIIAPSESVRQILVDEYGITERVTIIPTGLKLEPFQRANGGAIRQERGWGEDRVLISVGRLVKEKNWPLLLEAAAQVIQTQPQLRLVIIGEGEERKNLEKLAGQLNLADRIEFTGRLPFDQVIGYLKAADLFCFASAIETQGLVTMEALAAGLPVVAVDGGGTRDTVTHGQEGLLTAGDSHALATAIERVIGDEALLHRFKQAARQRALTFDTSAQAAKLLAVYEQAAADKKAHQYVSVEKHQPLFQLVKGRWLKLPL
jgi:glycosyltransferase involved in cell wall biosynthesis